MKKRVLQQVNVEKLKPKYGIRISCLAFIYVRHSKCSPSIHIPSQLNGNLQRNNTSNAISSKIAKKKKGFLANNILHLILQGVGSRRNAGAATSETAGDRSAVKLCDHLETFGCDIKAGD